MTAPLVKTNTSSIRSNIMYVRYLFILVLVLASSHHFSPEKDMWAYEDIQTAFLRASLYITDILIFGAQSIAPYLRNLNHGVEVNGYIWFLFFDSSLTFTHGYAGIKSFYVLRRQRFVRSRSAVYFATYFLLGTIFLDVCSLTTSGEFRMFHFSFKSVIEGTCRIILLFCHV